MGHTSISFSWVKSKLFWSDVGTLSNRSNVRELKRSVSPSLRRNPPLPFPIKEPFQ